MQTITIGHPTSINIIQHSRSQSNYRKKILLCAKCGETIIGQEQKDTFIRNRIIKFRNGVMFAICTGRTGYGKPCKEEIKIPNELMFSLLQEGAMK